MPKSVAGREWQDPLARSLGMRQVGLVGSDTEHGEPTALLLLANAYHEELPFVLPEAGGDSMEWQVLLDTRDTPGASEPFGGRCYDIGDEYPLGGRSLALLQRAPLAAPSDGAGWHASCATVASVSGRRPRPTR